MASLIILAPLFTLFGCSTTQPGLKNPLSVPDARFIGSGFEVVGFYQFTVSSIVQMCYKRNLTASKY